MADHHPWLAHQRYTGKGKMDIGATADLVAARSRLCKALQPTDLKGLRTGAGGDLPVARIVARIDGRDPMVAHGSPMPVWGEFFEGRYAAMKTPTGQPILTSQPIVDLVAYLGRRCNADRA